MRVVIDSSVLISLFSEEDKFHELALNTMKQIRKEDLEVYISTLVLPEVCGGITRVTQDKRKAQQAKSQIEELIKSGVFNVEELTEERMFNSAIFAIKFAVKGADAIISSLAQEKGAYLATFDEKLRKKITGKVKLFEI